MSRETALKEHPIPRLPQVPGTGVDQDFMDKLIDALQRTVYLLDATRQRNFTEITLTNTQENGGNLRVGDVFSDGGILKIVRTDDVFAGTLAATMAIGTVTVTENP